MNQKPLPSTNNRTRAKAPPSVIEQVRRTPHVAAARTTRTTQDVQPCSTTSLNTSVDVKTIASTVYSADNLYLNQLRDQVRFCVHDRLIKEREVLRIVGRSRAAMRRDVSLGMFVPPIKNGVKSSAWRESEVLGWVDAMTILSRVANPGFTMQEFVAAVMVNRLPMC